MTFDSIDTEVRHWLVRRQAQRIDDLHYGDAIWQVNVPEETYTFLSMAERLGRFCIEKKEDSFLLIFQNLEDICNAEHSS